MVLHGASLAARGGTYAYGMYSSASDTTLEAVDVTALAENGSTASYGLYNHSGSSSEVTLSVLEGAIHSVVQSTGAVTVSNSVLAGNVVSGTVTCVGVSRGGTFSASGCP